MRFRIGLRTRVAGAGEVFEVAPGVLHGFGNAGDEEARMRVEVRSALGMEQMLTDVIEMARRPDDEGRPPARAGRPCADLGGRDVVGALLVAESVRRCRELRH